MLPQLKNHIQKTPHHRSWIFRKLINTHGSVEHLENGKTQVFQSSFEPARATKSFDKLSHTQPTSLTTTVYVLPFPEASSRNKLTLPINRLAVDLLNTARIVSIEAWMRRLNLWPSDSCARRVPLAKSNRRRHVIPRRHLLSDSRFD